MDEQPVARLGQPQRAPLAHDDRRAQRALQLGNPGGEAIAQGIHLADHLVILALGIDAPVEFDPHDGGPVQAGGFDLGDVVQSVENILDGIGHQFFHRIGVVAEPLAEGARETVRRFIGASSTEEIIFVRGTTEAINLVAYSFLRPRLQPGDEILLTGMEHHSNIVPWQLVAREKGAKVVAAPVLDDGALDFEGWTALLNERTRFVAVVHVSNSLGTVNPVEKMIAAAKARGIPVLVDGAQSVAHIAVDFPALGADFFTCSAHKAYGPTGFGCLVAKRAILDAMPPWHGGGDMIRTVSFEGSTWAEPPYRFEAGTPDMAGAIGLAAAIDYVEALGLDAIAAHEHALLD